MRLERSLFNRATEPPPPPPRAGGKFKPPGSQTPAGLRQKKRKGGERRGESVLFPMRRRAQKVTGRAARPRPDRTGGSTNVSADLLHFMTPLPSPGLPSLFMERIKEPQQSVKHVGPPNPRPCSDKKARESPRFVFGHSDGGEFSNLFIFREVKAKITPPPWHGTKWKPSHGRQARLRGSERTDKSSKSVHLNPPPLYLRGRAPLRAPNRTDPPPRSSRAPRRLRRVWCRQRRWRRSRRINTAVSLKSSPRNRSTLGQLAADPFKRNIAHQLAGGNLRGPR